MQQHVSEVSKACEVVYRDQEMESLQQDLVRAINQMPGLKVLAPGGRFQGEDFWLEVTGDAESKASLSRLEWHFWAFKRATLEETQERLRLLRAASVTGELVTDEERYGKGHYMLQMSKATPEKLKSAILGATSEAQPQLAPSNQGENFVDTLEVDKRIHTLVKAVDSLADIWVTDAEYRTAPKNCFCVQFELEHTPKAINSLGVIAWAAGKQNGLTTQALTWGKPRKLFFELFGDGTADPELAAKHINEMLYCPAPSDYERPLK